MMAIRVRGKNGVSGKKYTPMIIPLTSISYITLNSNFFVVVMLNNGEKITSEQTFDDMKQQVDSERLQDIMAKMPRGFMDNDRPK